jgi:YVTN family beta-propeller protein
VKLRRRAVLAGLLAVPALRPPRATAGEPALIELFRVDVGAEPLGLARRADGALLVVAAGGRRLSLIDPASGAGLRRLDLAAYGRLNRVIAAPEAVYVTASVAGALLVIDPELSAVRASVPVGGFPQGMALHGDALLFVANTADGTVSVIDRATLAVTGTVAVGERPQELAVDAAHGRLLVLQTTTRSLAVVGLDSLRREAVWRSAELVRPAGLALTAEGDALVADAGAEALLLFDDGGRVRRRLTLPAGAVTPMALALSPDGGRVAVAGRDGSISVLRLDGGAATRQVVGLDLRAVLFAPDGRIFATSFGDGTLIGLADRGLADRGGG